MSSVVAPERQAEVAMSQPPLSLYVHIPWCVRKCPYCDFNSHRRRGSLPTAAYLDALIADLEYDLPLVQGRTVETIFFGGGTPSLFPPEAIAAFLHRACARLRIAADAEITLECNPGTAEHGRFRGYRQAGINRISLGVQSFDDSCLNRLGRIHDGSQAETAAKRAQDAGLDNLNLDLMYALPGQSQTMAEHDIQRAIDLRPAHLSHYQLTLEPNTLFAARPPQDIPDQDAAWNMQESCQRLIADAGYVQYEISAYARPGRQCRHNLNYWQFGDYLGIGAGAHGKLTQIVERRIWRRWKVKHPDAYLAAAGTAAAIGGDEDIPPRQRPFDYMLNALRLNSGFSLARFEANTGLAHRIIANELNRAQDMGWLEIARDHVRPTELGLRFANDIMLLFLHETDAHLDRRRSQ